MVPLLIKRYLWLVDTLRRSGIDGLTLTEINDAWSNPYNQLYKDSGCEEISRRTLLNHRHAIEEQLHIYIECIRAGASSRYRINTELQEDNPIVEWLLSAISTENLAAEYGSLSNKILLEPADPGTKYLGIVAQALRLNQCLSIDYQSYHFGAHLQRNIEIEPLALKMFRRRWYLLCVKVDAGAKRLYALDRIQKCELKNVKFEYPKGFNPTEYFKYFFGVSTDGYTEKPCRIVLRAYRELPGYLIAQPLHKTQEISETSEEYTDFSYWMCPAFDLVQEILSHGDQMEVMSPNFLRSHIKEILKCQTKLYADK